jgi:hypothetical protein
LLSLGRKAAARKQFAKAVELARMYADPSAEAFWLIELGRALLDEGALEDADRHASAALKIARPASPSKARFSTTEPSA